MSMIILGHGVGTTWSAGHVAWTRIKKEVTSTTSAADVTSDTTSFGVVAGGGDVDGVG